MSPTSQLSPTGSTPATWQHSQLSAKWLAVSESLSFARPLRSRFHLPSSESGQTRSAMPWILTTRVHINLIAREHRQSKLNFALFYRVLGRVRDTILGIQENLALVESSATILEGDSVRRLSMLDSGSIGFVLTSPPYLNAIDYPRAHKFSQWWLSPHTPPLGRSEYLGLRQSAGNNTDGDCLLAIPALSEPLAPFRDMPIYRTISRYVVDLAAVIDQLHRVVKSRAKVVLVVADNVIGGTVPAGLLNHRGSLEAQRLLFCSSNRSHHKEHKKALSLGGQTVSLDL